ncbi:hypothetical protein D6783_05035 [Candidatus Woesearchaeota archaeon]|nr:MAG: hypothetical protein D6783_05035 [Candidatus Woesearchaeota archaeon]
MEENTGAVGKKRLRVVSAKVLVGPGGSVSRQVTLKSSLETPIFEYGRGSGDDSGRGRVRSWSYVIQQSGASSNYLRVLQENEMGVCEVARTVPRRAAHGLSSLVNELFENVANVTHHYQDTRHPDGPHPDGPLVEEQSPYIREDELRRELTRHGFYET